MSKTYELKMKKNLIFITGAGRGFGRSCALVAGKFFENESLLIICGRNERKLLETKLLVETMNALIRVEVFKLDLETVSSDEIKSILDKILKLSETQFECFVIIHNAGNVGDLSKCSYEFMERKVIESFTNINMTGTVIVNNVLLKEISHSTEVRKANDKPLILLVNVSSLCAIQPFESMSMYCAMKAFREMFFQCLAVEWEAKQRLPDLFAINYSPGPMDTEMMAYLIDNAASDELTSQMRILKENGKLINPDNSAEKLFYNVLANYFNYKSGSRIDFYDL